MIHVECPSAIERPALARLGAILRSSVKTRPGLWFGLVALSAFGVAWVPTKWLFVAGGRTLFTLVHDAAHQVGVGGIWGALGGALSAASNYVLDKFPHHLPGGFNVETGRYDLPGGGSIGAAPNAPGDPHPAAGPIIDWQVKVPGVQVHDDGSLKINQQNVHLTGAGSTAPGGKSILNAKQNEDGTFDIK